MQIAIIALALIAYSGIPAAAIATDKSKRKMGRKSFLFWILGLVLLATLRSLIKEEADLGGVGGWAMFFNFINLALVALKAIIVFWVFARRVLWRVRDTGWKPAFSYIYVIPLVNLIFIIVLLFVPPAASSIKAPIADSPH